MTNRLHYILFPSLVFIITTTALFLGIYNSWFGDVYPGIMKFCEYCNDGYIKQPANTFSNIGFTIVGFYLAWYSYKNLFPYNNNFSESAIYPIMVSCSLIFLGAGSFALHATNAIYGGYSDVIGMFLISSLFFSFALIRLFRLSKNAFFLIYLINISFCLYIFFSPHDISGFVLHTFEICIASQLLLAMSIEVYMKRTRSINIDSSMAVKAVLSLVVAFIIWNLSVNRDSFWCNPNSLIQGHAIWHLLCALSSYYVIRYYISESPIS